MTGPLRALRDYKGTVDTSDGMAAQLELLAGMLPLGIRVAHRSGRIGTVAIDQPSHVPGRFDGKPTAWCLDEHDEPWICANWTNDRGLDRWLVWCRMAHVQKAGGLRLNKPGLGVPSGGGR